MLNAVPWVFKRDMDMEKIKVSVTPPKTEAEVKALNGQWSRGSWILVVKQ